MAEFLDKEGLKEYTALMKEVIESRTKKESIIEVIYPVGTIYSCTEEIIPSESFGGVWEELKDESDTQSKIIKRWKRIA